ncbi:MAG: DNA polymerase III subunit beta [Candidatus Sungbacteria bacterium]|uniref:Beta sliding clamp n=1 Tax=Candidatus Sungiibacteriota bacterium TaxID=2750080 RepID=A0A933DT49_9BACT|nr:DNA polymerase III subunit beta [Candidatus Sungbacteria bacterium]
MKITCTTEYLRVATLTAERFTGRHVTLPILSHILVVVKERKISLNATNLEMGIEYTVPGKIQKTGAVTTPAKLLTQTIQSIQDETITLEAKQHQLILHTGSSSITLHGLNPSDFPALPTIKKEHGFTIAVPQFVAGLRQVITAAATTDLKPELAGVLLAVGPHSVTLVATDSFRLAEKTIPNTEGAAEDTECIVPSRTMAELLRAVTSDEGEIQVGVGEHQIVCEWNETKILSRLIDGTYPPYKNLFPKAYETTLVVNRDDLIKKIRLASVFSSRLNDVTLVFSPSEVTVNTTNTETGQTTSRLPVQGRGAAGSVMFNYRYLLDGLDAAGGKEVALHLNGVSGPALIQNPADTSLRYLIMPIRSA